MYLSIRILYLQVPIIFFASLAEAGGENLGDKLCEQRTQPTKT